MASCESWLDEDPQYTINTKTQFSTVENAKQALMGCYGYMSADNAYGQAWQEVTFGYCGFDDTILDDFLKDWAVVQKKLYAGEITQAEYFEWKIMWPDE